MQTAKLFTNGRSQALRLPKAFRFEGVTEVTIEKDGDALVVRPVTHPDIQKLIESIDLFESFPERDQPAENQKRPGW
jgi:antitoxin VapB